MARGLFNDSLFIYSGQGRDPGVLLLMEKKIVTVMERGTTLREWKVALGSQGGTDALKGLDAQPHWCTAGYACPAPLAMAAHTFRICFKRKTLMNGGCLILLLRLCPSITWCIISARQSLHLLREQSSAVANADAGNERERRLTPPFMSPWGS